MLRIVKKTEPAAFDKTWVRFAGCRHEVLYSATAAGTRTPPEADTSIECPICARVDWVSLQPGKLYRLYFLDVARSATICVFVRPFPGIATVGIFKTVAGVGAGKCFNVSMATVAEIRSLQ